MEDPTTFPEVGDQQYSEDNVNNMQQDTFEQQEQTFEQDMGGVEEQPSEPALPDGWREGDWKCKKCNDHNFASRIACRACGVPKAGVAKVQEKKPDNWRPGDWQCSRCGDHQFASRMYCRQCDAPKNASSNNTEKSADPKKLYVGNLNPATLEQPLKDAMSRFGQVTDCYILGPKGNSKGFAFVEFADVENAKSALGASFELDGNSLKIEKSMSRRDDLGGAWAPPDPVPANKLYVGKVTAETTHEEFKEYLSQFGEIKDSVVMGERGFGFVTFKDAASAQAALSAKLELNGKELQIQRAKPKRNDDYGAYPNYPPRDRYGYRGRDDYYGGRGYDDYYGRGHGYDDYYGGRGWGGGGYGPPPHRGRSRGWSPPRNRNYRRGRW